MTVKIQDETLKLTQNLEARNKEVDKAYTKIILNALLYNLAPNLAKASSS